MIRFAFLRIALIAALVVVGGAGIHVAHAQSLGSQDCAESVCANGLQSTEPLQTIPGINSGTSSSALQPAAPTALSNQSAAGVPINLDPNNLQAELASERDSTPSTASMLPWIIGLVAAAIVIIAGALEGVYWRFHHLRYVLQRLPVRRT